MTHSLSLSLSQAAYDKAPFKNWELSGRLAGEVKSAAGLTFVAVEEAGHMVPMNQPEVVSVGVSVKEEEEGMDGKREREREREREGGRIS